MCLIAEAIAPFSALPLVEADALGDLELELERTVPTAERRQQRLWVWGPGASNFDAHTVFDPSLDDVSCLESIPGGALYRFQWDAAQNTLFTALADLDITLLECVGTNESWELRLRAPSHTSLSDLRTRCEAHGISLEFDRITSVAEESAPLGTRLTDDQREALVLALERGYFDDHRRTSLDELGRELDISRQAVSGRLRRAYRTLAEQVRDEAVKSERSNRDVGY
ncbi:helix-turn-helix domain-containing protein [Haloferax larsenii]|uniref:Helix-turn-helix domain-containing protein n=1 Tax=Haloferax larsenii TaxID=302484 RepID=A0ABY5R9U5_HALLR|nr:helix-turn-helix domain-containing protein [Haloferax larsenii]UVE48964.1 helix-turn-helix domain-containing protein [Haloferax larsenii]